ncbi:MAG: CHASE2 domain-containing protein [Acidobacteria bacterium]|nr:CHASE2 domain-containing protein [Acidobacteriota bacterium]
MTVSFCAGAVVASVSAAGFLDSFELPARDALLRLRSPRPVVATAVVAIDEESLRVSGSWPWPRERVAALVDRVAASGARTVAVDILLAEPRPGDDELALSLEGAGATLVSGLDGEGKWVVPPPALSRSARLAHGMIELDRDGVMRRLSMTKQAGEMSLPALSIAMASALRDAVVVTPGSVLEPGFRARTVDVPVVSAAGLLEGRTSEALRGRVVFIGLTALALGDRAVTPTTVEGRPDAGVVVHAAATEALVSGDVVHEVPPVVSGLLAAAFVALTFAWRPRRMSRRVAVGIALLATPLVAGIALLFTAKLLLPIVALALATGAAVGVMETLAAWRLQRSGSEAVARIASGLGDANLANDAGLVERLDELGALLDRRRRSDVESRRVLAHELKTPLASVRGLTQLLSGYKLGEDETRRVVALIEKETDKLQAMVGSLLEIERLALRELEATATTVDLSSLGRDRAELLRAGVAPSLVAEIEPGVRVRGDAALLERAIDNLVGNAVKYSPVGSKVSLRVMTAHVGAVVEVGDEGPGISAEERATIFQRFKRGSSAGETEGLGLGLALVAEVVKWHRGEVDVREGVRSGSIFRIVLPLTT